MVNSVRLSQDAAHCVTGSVDRTVKIWSLERQECLHILVGHEGPITTVQQLSPLIISSSAVDKTVRLWNQE